MKSLGILIKSRLCILEKPCIQQKCTYGKKKRVEVSHSKSRQLCFQIASKHNKNPDKMIIQIKEYINFQYTTEIIKKTLKDAYYD